MARGSAVVAASQLGAVARLEAPIGTRAAGVGAVAKGAKAKTPEKVGQV